MLTAVAQRFGTALFRLGRWLRGDAAPDAPTKSPVLIELIPAFIWDCDACGRENLQRTVSVELDRDDPVHAAIMRREFDIADGEPIPEWVGLRIERNPAGVMCRHCNTRFRCVPPSNSSPVDED